MLGHALLHTFNIPIAALGDRSDEHLPVRAYPSLEIFFTVDSQLMEEHLLSTRLLSSFVTLSLVKPIQ